MPLMFSLLGWALGLLVLSCVACLGVLTSTLMVRVGIAERTQSYHKTILRSLGPVGKPTFSHWYLMLEAAYRHDALACIRWLRLIPR